MKCGTMASVITFAYLHRIRAELNGKLTLTAVSDEETGGKWGTRYLLENLGDECLGDCVLNGEPSSPSLFDLVIKERSALHLRSQHQVRTAHIHT